jgi:hypothetical protein
MMRKRREENNKKKDTEREKRRCGFTIVRFARARSEPCHRSPKTPRYCRISDGPSQKKRKQELTSPVSLHYMTLYPCSVGVLLSMLSNWLSKWDRGETKAIN